MSAPSRLLTALWLGAALAAQEPAVAPAADAAATAAAAAAAKADVDVVAAFHQRADALAAQKQFGRAVQLRREILQEWAPGDPKALKALGFVQVGAEWRRDGAIVVADRDQKGDGKVLKKLEQEWVKTQKDLVKLVEQAAQQLTAAGDVERATVYWRRLLRLKPGDVRATASLQLPTFDGHAGTPDELRIVRRGRAIAQAVRFLGQYEVATTRIAEPHPLLQKAGLGHVGLQSDHFRIYGALPEDKVQLAARCAERALLLARAMFGSAGGATFRPVEIRDIVWVGDKATYKRLLDLCKDQFAPDRLRFLQDEVDLAFVDVGGAQQRLYAKTIPGDDLFIDVTSRGVVQDAVGFHTDGLWEGLGHAACGFLFDRTLSFFVEQQHGGTVTSWHPKPLLPEMSAWREMAAESAWAKNDTPTARLVLMQGYRLTNEERVKAWAMVDFLVRSRPDLLLQLDVIKTDQVKDEDAVKAAFQKATGVELKTIDEQWRAYWGRGEALRTAMQAEPAGKPADVDAARPLATAIARARAVADRPPGGFVLAQGADATAAHDYVQALAKHALDQRDPKKKDLPPPSPPLCLDTTVLLWRSADANAAVGAWLLQPALRDWLLHPGRDIVAVSAQKTSLVLDLTTPAEPIARGLPLPWPRSGQSDLPGAVRVADLGPALQAPLLAAGIDAAATVGLPVSLHFHRDLPSDVAAGVGCRLRVRGLDRDGVLVALQGADGLAAPGCFVFVPKEPLAAGEAEVQWTLPRGFLAKDEVFPRVPFTVK